MSGLKFRGQKKGKTDRYGSSNAPTLTPKATLHPPRAIILEKKPSHYQRIQCTVLYHTDREQFLSKNSNGEFIWVETTTYQFLNEGDEQETEKFKLIDVLTFLGDIDKAGDLCVCVPAIMYISPISHFQDSTYTDVDFSKSYSLMKYVEEYKDRWNKSKRRIVQFQNIFQQLQKKTKHGRVYYVTDWEVR